MCSFDEHEVVAERVVEQLGDIAPFDSDRRLRATQILIVPATGHATIGDPTLIQINTTDSNEVKSGQRFGRGRERVVLLMGNEQGWTAGHFLFSPIEVIELARARAK